MNVKKFAWCFVVFALLQPATSRRKSKCYGQYTCQQTGYGTHTCIDQSQICDRARDCPNGEDEKYCDGSWAGWAGWNDCSRSCGGGYRVRYRTCSDPSPKGQGSDCVGPSAEVTYCKQHECPVNGGWNEWQGWSVCDKACGGGMKRRYRACDCPQPSGGGTDCTGKADESTECMEQPCPVNGVWTDWAPCPCVGGPCNGKHPGGLGHQTLYRSCTKTRPEHGGEFCNGEPTKEEHCSKEFGHCSGGQGRKEEAPLEPEK